MQIPGDNLYVYCANNPLRYVDPNGEWFVFAFFAMFVTALQTPDFGDVLTAGLSAGLTSYVGSMFHQPTDFWDSVITYGAQGAISGGINAAFTGGDFGKAMYQGGAWGAGFGAMMYGVNKLERPLLPADTNVDIDPNGKVQIGSHPIGEPPKGSLVGKLGARHMYLAFVDSKGKISGTWELFPDQGMGKGGFWNPERERNSFKLWGNKSANILKDIPAKPLEVQRACELFKNKPYDFLYQNSNTAIGDVLRSIGYEVPAGMEWTPGWPRRWTPSWIPSW